MKKDKFVDEPALDTPIDGVTSIFKCLIGFKGCLYTSCCLPFGCFGCGPTIRINEGERAAVLKYGKFDKIVGPGTYAFNIGRDQYLLRSIQIQTLVIPQQRALTRDNVAVTIDSVVFYKIVDVKRAIFNVRDPATAIANLALGILPSLMGEKTLDEVFANRERINKRTTELMDQHTEEWGIQIQALEIRDIKIPDTMERVMAAVAEATREGEAKVVTAQAELKAAKTFSEAAEIIGKNPVALQLRYFQTLSEIASEKSSTIIVPSEVTNMFRGLGSWNEPHAFGQWGALPESMTQNKGSNNNNNNSPMEKH